MFEDDFCEFVKISDAFLGKTPGNHFLQIVYLVVNQGFMTQSRPLNLQKNSSVMKTDVFTLFRAGSSVNFLSFTIDNYALYANLT